MGTHLAFASGMARLSIISALVALAFGCAPSELDEAILDTGVEGPFEALPGDMGAADSAAAAGPRVVADSATEVWPATNAWADTDTLAAREAGIAWEADSGLNWEEKFEAWIESFELTDRSGGSGETFVLPTPYGERSFPAPNLECAEVAVFLRATFASWYHLPFYLSGWDANSRQMMYAGHFGFVNAAGERVGKFPNFRSSYRDHESTWAPGQDWPSDGRLAGMRLGDDDGLEFEDERILGEGAGAYFDAIYLNKRVGYFMRLVLLYFGSTNLADDTNMVHVTPESSRAGDILLHRWQKRGVGHVMPIMKVVRHAVDALEISIASGSMPRREPLWEKPEVARRRFVSRSGGGAGETYDGDAYATLGGGLRRWRTAVQSSGRWRNDTLNPELRVVGEEAIAARPDRFDEILRTLTPEDYRDAALVEITTYREHLSNYPASCSARIHREEAFETLHEVMAELGWTPAEVDARYRTLEDHVFGELTYEESRTCCWNRTTSGMFEVIMDYARKEQEAATEAGECLAPTVFRSEAETGYGRWAAHAETMGIEWVEWSEDESCPQRDAAEDVIAPDAPTFSCAPEEEEADPCGPAQESAALAIPLAAMGGAGMICEDEEDWYRVEGPVTVHVRFDHGAGDIDVKLENADGQEVASSTSASDDETIVVPEGLHFLQVFGYRGAKNEYSLELSSETP